MGTRLYPITTPNILEALINVPEGTYARLKEFQKSEPKIGDSAMDAWYEKLSSDDHLKKMHSFDLFGWGKLTPEAATFIESLGLDQYCGTLNGDNAKKLMDLQQVTADDVYEVSWS